MTARTKQEDLDNKLDQILANLIYDSKRKSGLGGLAYFKYKQQIVELINSEVLSALGEIKKPTMEEIWPSKPYGDSSYDDILKALGWYSKQIESIKNRYKL